MGCYILDSRTGAAAQLVQLRMWGVEEWHPPVPMETVLARLDSSAKAKADFDAGVIRIIPHEYETVLAVAAEL